jgi:hypothetical protein
MPAALVIIGGICAAASKNVARMVLGLVALLRCKRDDIPAVMRATFSQPEPPSVLLLSAADPEELIDTDPQAVASRDLPRPRNLDRPA